LKDRYDFESPNIYSNDLVENPPINFQVLSIPEGRSVYKVYSDEVVLEFVKRGIEVEAPSSSTITFSQKVDFDKKRVTEHIEKLFKTKYQDFDIEIESMDVEPTSSLSLEGFEIEKIDFDLDDTDKTKGSFRVDFIDEAGRKKATYFGYEIKASILGYVALKDIRGNEPISLKDFTQKRVDLSLAKKRPVRATMLENAYSRNYIQKDSLITENFIKKLPDVKRGDRVVVSDDRGAIFIQSIAEALDNGSIGDVIRVRLKNDKVANGVVISKNKVKLR
jgi:flagella basal body P-ring formation protein FlgA